MVSFVREYTAKGSCPLAGNTVHADKAFLVKYMPDFMEHLHYRIVDVSTIKELCRYVKYRSMVFIENDDILTRDKNSTRPLVITSEI